MLSRSAPFALRGAAWTAALVLAHAGFLLASAPGDKTPVPSEADQEAALRLLREVYRQEYEAAKTPADRQAFAEKLLRQADLSADATERFVILRVCRDVATEAGDADTALQAVEETARTFQIEDFAAQVETLEKVSQSAGSTEAREAVAKHAMALVDQAVDADDFSTAGRLVKLALAAAHRARKGTLAKQIAAREKEVKELASAYAAVKEALAKLEERPTDPEANLAVGRFYCIRKGDWGKGVPLLALGSDAALKSLAVSELKGASTPEEQAALGDGWWEFAEKEEGLPSDHARARAEHWYRQAAPQLSGLAKGRIVKRLRELAGTQAGARKTTSRTRSTRRSRDPFVRIHIAAHIDGKDDLTLSSDRAQWVHRASRWPHAVTINGVLWSPEGSPVLEFQKAGLEGLADVSFPTAQVARIQGRGAVHLQRAEDHVVITFDDPSAAAATYEIIVAFKRRQ